MHRYQPRFHIVYLPPKTNNSPYNADQECLHNHYRRFIFTETSFTAVTAYQNQRVSFSLFSIFVEHFEKLLFLILFVMMPL